MPSANHREEQRCINYLDNVFRQLPKDRGVIRLSLMLEAKRKFAVSEQLVIKYLEKRLALGHMLEVDGVICHAQTTSTETASMRDNPDSILQGRQEEAEELPESLPRSVGE